MYMEKVFEKVMFDKDTESKDRIHNRSKKICGFLAIEQGNNDKI